MAVQAWMLAISSLRAALTRRWRLRELRPWNWGETMSDVKAWPQPPVYVFVLCQCGVAGGGQWMMMEGCVLGRTGHVGDFDVGGLEALGYGLAET